MVEIKEVKTKKEFKKFVKFPTKLYANCPYYVPPFEDDELNLTNPKKNANFEDTDAVYFLAYRDEKVVGRIAGLICHLYNKKNKTKYARFSRFDVIDDSEVAKALLSSAEKWAKEKGMEFIHGPLGFNDLEREGLMVEGFDRLGEFQTSYNFPYYQKHIEENGYTVDVRWVEWNLPVGEPIERIVRVCNAVEKRYGFYEKKFKSPKEVINKYGLKFFELLDECFENIYGTMPFSKKVIKQTIAQFKLVLQLDYISLVFNKEDELIGFGLGYPSLAQALHDCKGRYFPTGIFKLLNAIKKPKSLELGLIAVKPEYQKKGVTAIILNNMFNRAKANGIKYAQTGVQLETNTKVLSVFDEFDRELIRKKNCYIKKI